MNKHASSDPVEYLIAKAVGRCLSFQLAPDLVVPNFPPGTGLPKIVLGGVNWKETKDQLEVADIMQSKFGLKTSAKHLYEITQMPPCDPNDPADVPPGPNANQPAAPGTATGLPSLTGTPEPTPTPAMAFPADIAPRFSELFAANQHGHYPGAMHAQFGMGEAAFAEMTRCKRKLIRVRGGGTDWVWVAPAPAPPVVPPAIPPAVPGQTFSAHSRLDGQKILGAVNALLTELQA